MSETCVAVINEGPRKGNTCQFPPKENGYCDRHQRNKMYDDAIKEGKQYCRFLFRGCDNFCEVGSKSCNACKLTRSKKQYKCLKEDCKFNVEVENSYCGKHKIEELKNYEKENNVKYCKINRGCRNILEEGYNNCSDCNNTYKNIMNEYRKSKTIPFIYNTSNKELNKFQNQKTDSIDEFWRNIQRGAMERNMLITLSFDDYINLALQPCYYCGFQSEYKVNGIDRIDNNKGYIQTNCVSCCKMCNLIKHTSHPQAFIDKVKTIVKYNKENVPISEELINKWNKIYLTSNSTSYAIYTSEVKSKKNIEMRLTKEEYNTLKLLPCYLCGIKPSSFHKNGIDRIDSSIKEYNTDNSRSCCYHCNLMKNDFDLSLFLEKCKEIDKFNCNTELFNSIQLLLEQTQKRQEYYSEEDVAKLVEMGYESLYLEWCEKNNSETILDKKEIIRNNVRDVRLEIKEITSKIPQENREVVSSIVKTDPEIPKQWKVTNIYEFIKDGNEEHYISWCKENNEIHDASINSFITKIKNNISDITFCHEEIQKFIIELRTARTMKLLETNKKDVVEREDRQQWPSATVLKAYKEGKIGAFKKFTEEYAGDSGEKWEKRWVDFDASLADKTDEEATKLISKFMTAQRKKKYDRSKREETTA